MKVAFNPYRLHEWHLWFAWFPVRTQDGYRVWGETILRRDVCSEAAAGHCGPIWQYRATLYHHLKRLPDD